MSALIWHPQISSVQLHKKNWVEWNEKSDSCSLIQTENEEAEAAAARSTWHRNCLLINRVTSDLNQSALWNMIRLK